MHQNEEPYSNLHPALSFHYLSYLCTYGSCNHGKICISDIDENAQTHQVRMNYKKYSFYSFSECKIVSKYPWITFVSSLERELGPDTADLALRIGLHSGPVTAGVLRGQKSRFQLFGDTVNTG